MCSLQPTSPPAAHAAARRLNPQFDIVTETLPYFLKYGLTGGVNE